MHPLYFYNSPSRWMNHSGPRFSSSTRLPMNIKQTTETFEITFQLNSEIDISKVSIELDQDELVIKYANTQTDNSENKEDQSTWIRKEFWQDESFARSFQVPQEVDSENITANIKNGLLTVSLPIKGKAQKRSITIAQV